MIESEKLPSHFIDTVDKFYLPLACDLAFRVRHKTPLIVGVNGAQGTGKSTLSAFLTLLLTEFYKVPAVALSIDDLYLPQAERLQLAKEVHPMLAVRGVPGTHDVALGVQLIDQLVHAQPGDVTAIPAFDKARDDRKPHDQWPTFQGRPSVIILEGWCVGARPLPASDLIKPVNDLEVRLDPEGIWRHYVNKQLEQVYPALYTLFDLLVMIAAPNWEVVFQWRSLQEEKLRERCQQRGLDNSAVMSPAEVKEFIQYYERITRTCLVEMPGRADYVFSMDEKHCITRMKTKKA